MHHDRNWINLPRGIEREVDKLFQSIQLPCPDLVCNINTTTKFNNLSNTLKSDILTTGANHLTQARENLANIIQTLSHTDFERALDIASGQLRRKFGGTLTPANIQGQSG